jgi:hypothetical protein
VPVQGDEKMNLGQIAKELCLEGLTAGQAIDEVASVDRAHASDLLSDVLANAPAGGVLLTIQVHMNVVAVAVHAGLKAVIFSSGMKPSEDVRAKAAAEKISLFSTPASTFDVAGKLYALGLRGRKG